MGRSQRHIVWEQGASSAGEIHAQGMVAPGIAMQVNPEAMNELQAGPALFNTGLELREPLGDGSVEVPTGAPGGPLQGSTLTGAIPESLAPEPEPPDPELAPVLTEIIPNAAPVGGEDITLVANGEKFVQGSLIMFNNSANETVFVSDTQVTTIVKPSTASGPWTVPVQVKNPDGQITTPLDFTFTEETVPEGGGEQPPERTLPAGPYTISNIEDHEDGLALTVDGSPDIRAGDTVLIEATGNTSVNGSYSVYAIMGAVVIIDNDYVLEAPIAAKGRITVN